MSFMVLHSASNKAPVMLQAGLWQRRLLCRYFVGVVSVVEAAEACHGQDVWMHVDWHTLGVLHYATL